MATGEIEGYFRAKTAQSKNWLSHQVYQEINTGFYYLKLFIILAPLITLPLATKNLFKPFYGKKLIKTIQLYRIRLLWLKKENQLALYEMIKPVAIFPFKNFIFRQTGKIILRKNNSIRL